MTELEIVCAWCGKVLGVKDGKGQEDASHGICSRFLLNAHQ